MRTVNFPESFGDWRQVTRQLLAQETPPADVLWTAHSEQVLPFDHDTVLRSTSKKRVHSVPRSFLALAEQVACHRNPVKWEILYRLLWKLTHEAPDLLKVGLDPDLIQSYQMIRAVRRDCHKMKAFVRFRELDAVRDVKSAESHQTCLVAWFEPEHFIVEKMAPFFKKRFANDHWSILTPDMCVHWNREELIFTKGVDKAMTPKADNFEQLWLTYYKNIFNPARLKEKAMLAEMPKKYWKNLPEASLISDLIDKGRRKDLSREWVVQ